MFFIITLLERKHHRRVFETPEVPDIEDLEMAEQILDKLGNRVSLVDKAESSWYKFESADIPIMIQFGHGEEKLIPLSQRSTIVSGLKAISRTRIYVPLDKKEEARTIVTEICK